MRAGWYSLIILLGCIWNIHSAAVLKLQEIYPGDLPRATTRPWKVYCTSTVLSNSMMPKQYCTSILLSPSVYHISSLAWKYLYGKSQINYKNSGISIFNKMKTVQKLETHFPCCLWHFSISISKRFYVLF